MRHIKLNHYSKHVSIFVLFCLTAFKICAQASFLPGYVVTNNNDTLRGFIDFRNNDKNSKKCDFRINETAEVVTYSPGEIKEYRFIEGKYFVTKDVGSREKKELFFVEYMVNGVTDLYYLWDNGPHYLIEQSNGQIYELTNSEKSVTIDGTEHRHKSNQYIGLLKAIFQDCPKVFPMIDKATLENRSLINITKKYHEYVCNNEQCIVYENTLPSLKIRIAPAISTNCSFLRTGDNQEFPSSYEPSVFLLAGFIARLDFPRWNKKFALLVGNEFGLNEYYKNDNPLILNIPANRETSISASVLRTIVALKYVIPRGAIKPAFQLGYCNNLFLKWDAESHAETTYNNITRVYNYTGGPFVKNFKGGMLGAGIEFRVAGTRTGFIDLLFQHTFGKYATLSQTKLVYIDNSLNTISLSGGFFF